METKNSGLEFSKEESDRIKIRLKEIGESFGSIGRNGKEKYVLRFNTGDDPYFGFVIEGSDSSGPYADICCVIFPSSTLEGKWIVSIAVGSKGYEEDYQIAKKPGTRRSLLKIDNSDPNHELFIKSDFSDIETSSEGLKNIIEKIDDEVLLSTMKQYSKLILACQMMNGFEEKYVRGFIAFYAKLRGWPNKSQRKEVDDAIDDISKKEVKNDDENNIKALLETRKYVVIQGAPGTGKTYTAKKIASEIAGNDNVVFTQFHAETTYGDFIYCIKPKINDESGITYDHHYGVLINAIDKCKDAKKVVLIIDEINRANLSNVLGEAFYLFEKKYCNSDENIKIKIGEKEVSMPDNLYVIATMNTADRSLAVVDFALRRRFAWYTLTPHEIESKDGIYFAKYYFDKMSDIFEEHATSEELNLQPGQSYFIIEDSKETDKNKRDKERDEKIKDRMKYELLPLIREYLNEGLLVSAKECFEEYFRTKIGEELYK